MTDAVLRPLPVSRIVTGLVLANLVVAATIFVSPKIVSGVVTWALSSLAEGAVAAFFLRLELIRRRKPSAGGEDLTIRRSDPLPRVAMLLALAAAIGSVIASETGPSAVDPIVAAALLGFLAVMVATRGIRYLTSGGRHVRPD